MNLLPNVLTVINVLFSWILIKLKVNIWNWNNFLPVKIITRLLILDHVKTSSLTLSHLKTFDCIDREICGSVFDVYIKKQYRDTENWDR